MKFLRNVLSTIVGLFLFFVIGFFLLAILGALLGSSSEDKVIVKDNSVLELKLDFTIKDYAAKTL
ncbi:MAG: signal peptide peptidase SppA, partial [Bacteroidia bacterium]|nr:signal peptide peptidase SppA [Bacteroidia bacterium]